MNKKIFLAIFAILIAISGANAQHGGGNGNGGGNNNRCDDNNGGGNRSLRIIGLTSDQRLVCFNENNPGNARTIGTISGLTGGDTMLVGIDFRVQDGNLYGVGNAGGVYRIDATTAVATFVNRLTVALNGTFFGVDFNPAADRLRVISDTGQNLRHNVNPGGVTINDTPLSYSAMGSPVATGVTGAAYTNNDLDPSTATTLFDIDSNLDQVAIQSPANNGILAATGKLGVDTTPNVGFDIYSTLRNDVTEDNEAFASLTSTADNRTRLYSINLLTGKATLSGAFSNQNQVIDIAIPLNQR
jgi:hypothetical protein